MRTRYLYLACIMCIASSLCAGQSASGVRAIYHSEYETRLVPLLTEVIRFDKAKLQVVNTTEKGDVERVMTLPHCARPPWPPAERILSCAGVDARWNPEVAGRFRVTIR